MLIQYPVRAPRPVADAWQYPKPKVSRNDGMNKTRAEAGEEQGQQRFFIQGKRAFVSEWNAFQGFIAAGWDPDAIQFQEGFLGGRFFKGGIVVDFILPTSPLPTPVFVDGEHWHQGEVSSEELTERLRLDDANRGFMLPNDVLYGSDVLTVETATMAIIAKFGSPF